MNKIGLMQGRLSLPTKGRIQAFPQDTWKLEFEEAKKLGLASIEWILESNLELNPLWTAGGRSEIDLMRKKTGLSVDYVCVDYFMEEPLVRMSQSTKDSNQYILRHTIEACYLLGMKGIEIPMVDASRIENKREVDELLGAIDQGLNLAHEKGLKIGLETCLAPDQFRALLEKADHPSLRANYDSGNSASSGYDPDEEIDAYGSWINNVHIKDRIFSGSTVPLGQGDADIPKVLKALTKIGYEGDYVLQGARQNGPESKTVNRYAVQVRDWLKQINLNLDGSRT